MNIQTIDLDFDPKISDVLRDLRQLESNIKWLSENDKMPDDQKAFYLENELRHMAYINRIMKQVFEERT